MMISNGKYEVNEYKFHPDIKKVPNPKLPNLNLEAKTDFL